MKFLAVKIHPLLYLFMFLAATVRAGGRPAIGYVTVGGRLSSEDSAAVAWVEGEKIAGLTILDAARSRLDSPGVDIVWIHVADSAEWARWTPAGERLHSLAQFYRGGGKLLLTGFGALIPHMIGIESETPEIRPEAIVNDWLFDQKGFQGLRGHPVFDGLLGGAFIWDTDADNTAYRVGWFDGKNPREGKVVGVEKSYVSVESTSRILIEYAGGKGKGISIGAFVRFARPNADRARMELLLRNTLMYLAGRHSATPRTYWWKGVPGVRRFSAATPPLARAGTLSGSHAESGLLIRHSVRRNQFFDLSGRRTLLMGRESGGIDELWVQPFRVLRDFRVGLVDGDSIVPLVGEPATVEIRPESFTRIYATRFGPLKEILFPSPRRGGALVQYTWTGGARGCPLIVTFRCDLRWMWPYDERAGGDLLWAYDASLHALHVRDGSGNFSCVVGAGIPPRSTLTGAYGGVRLHGGALRGDTTAALQVYHAAVYDMPGRTMLLAVAGTDLGPGAALADYRALLGHPEAERRNLADHYRSLLSRMVTVESPDSDFDAQWRWALVGADRFIMETPRLGTALVAGFSTTERGWDGGQRVSGRPGYAWYFGRDAEWSGLALDACGGAGAVRGELEFLQRYQDVTGKILHELTATGVAHYDAADATPLYLVLAADYLRATGDLRFIRASWPHIERAMQFLFSTDSDGDGLIENTNVGHGWVEGGKLWPPHTEFYLAGIWGQALQDAAWMAALAGKEDLARRYARNAAVVKHQVDSSYWNQRTRFYDYAMLRDGSYNHTETVLPAPVMSFGWLDRAKSLAVLRRFAGGAFCSDWGMRIVGDDSPLFNPRGYHEGSVWPLFTGWTSLAAYAHGNTVQGFTLMSETMAIATHWAAGFVQEVLDGAVYAPSGVCPHQCWSETAILHPGARGMIGWTPDATTMTASLVPRFPVHWDRVRVRNLRMGGSTVDLSFDRKDGSVRYGLQLTSGPPVTIDLNPEILQGAEVTGVSVTGYRHARTAEVATALPAAPIRVNLRDSVMVAVDGRGGVGVIPPVPSPAPGDSSGDFRFLGARMAGNEYTLDLEGRPGSTGEIGIRLFRNGIDSVSGGSVVGTYGPGVVTIRVPFGSDSARRTESRVVVHLRQ